VVLEEGWCARRLAGGELLLEDVGPARAALAPAVDAARIEIFNNLFMHIAEQMGEVLRATAQSVNIRERLDYSCALFDSHGALVANAPHMPVHLGSMGASVRSVIAAQAGPASSGGLLLLNSPYHGGTHLPDMTVVTPVFIGQEARPDSRRLARPSRRHRRHDPRLHAALQPHDRGGRRAVRMLCAGECRRRCARASCARAQAAGRGRHAGPSRTSRTCGPAGRQRARHREIGRSVRRHGLDTMRAYMRHVQEQRRAVRAQRHRAAATRSFRYEMDGGQLIAVRVDIDRERRRARIDFTAPRPRARTTSTPRARCVRRRCCTCFRTLLERPIP